MKILIKYLTKKAIPPFLIGLGGFIVFVSVEILYQLSYIIVRNRVGFDKLLLLIYYYLPYFTSMGIPVGVLLSIFWTVSELSEKNELMAFQVHGISLKNLIVPFLLMASILSLFSYYLNDALVPKTQVKIDEVMAKYIYKKPHAESYIVEDAVVKYENKFIYVKEYNKHRKVMKDVLIIDYSGGIKKITTAKEAVREDKYWYLLDGRFYVVEKDGYMKLDSTFKKLKLKMERDLGRLVAFSSPKKMSHAELVEAIRSIDDKKRAAKWVVELHTRYSSALAPVIIVLVGLSLSLLFNLTSKSWGVIITFVLVVLYQGSGAWLSAMGKEYLLDPVLSAWLPNIIFAASGFLIFIFIDTKTVQLLRELFTKLFVFVLIIILFPTVLSAASYEIFSKESYFESKIATFVGDVLIYEDGKKTVEAERAVYLLNKDILLLYDATKLTNSGTIRFSTSAIYDDFGQGFEGYDGIFNLKDGSVTINSASVVAFAKGVEEYFFYQSQTESIDKSGRKIINIAKFSLLDTRVSTNVKVKDLMGILSITDKKGEQIEGMVASYSGEEAEGFLGWIKTKVKGKWKKLYISGIKIIIKKEKYEVKGGYITTCDASYPHYYLALEYSEVMPQKYFVARNVVFTIFDMPVFYFPFFFQFLEEPPPVKLSLKISSDEISNSFAFNATYSKTGKAFFSISNKKDEPTKYSVSISDKIFGSAFSYSHTLQGESQSFKMKISPFKGTYFQATGSTSGVLKYLFYSKGNFLVFPYVLKIQRTYDDGGITWLLPDLSIKKKSWNLLGVKLTLNYIRYRGNLSYDEEDGDVFHNYDKTVHTGGWKVSASRSIIKDIGTSLSFAETGSFKYEESELKELNTTDTYKFQPYSKTIDFKIFKISTSRYFQLQTKRYLENPTEHNLSEGEKDTLSWNIFKFITGKVVYQRSSAYKLKEGEDEKFEKTSASNKASVQGNLNLLILPIAFSAQSTYDFLKEEKNWDYPDLSSRMWLNVFDWKLDASAKTKYYYDEDEPIKSIDFSFSQNYKSGRFKNQIYFAYKLNEDKPVEEIKDKFKASSLNILGYKSSFSGNFKLNIDPYVMTYFYVKGTFKKDKITQSLSLKYTSTVEEDYKNVYLKYSFKSPDPKISLSGRFTYNDEKWTVPSMSISLSKLLHKWLLSSSIQFTFDESVSFSKFTLSFKLVDFPDKFINYDILEGGFDIGVM